MTRVATPARQADVDGARMKEGPLRIPRKMGEPALQSALQAWGLV